MRIRLLITCKLKFFLNTNNPLKIGNLCIIIFLHSYTSIHYTDMFHHYLYREHKLLFSITNLVLFINIKRVIGD